MRKKDDVKIVIFPDETHEPKNFSIRKRTIVLLITLVITIMVLNIMGAATYFQLAKIAVNYSELEGENKILISQLQKLNALEKELSQIKKYNNKIRGIFGNQLNISKEAIADSENLNLSTAALATIYNFIPGKMPVSGYISRKFDANEHPAIDIAAQSGEKILATANGRVIFTGWSKDYGNVIILFHGQNMFSVYKHNLRNIVKENEFVTMGQVIALVGNTGKISSGPHLHFEIWKGNKPVDPLVYLKM